MRVEGRERYYWSHQKYPRGRGYWWFEVKLPGGQVEEYRAGFNLLYSRACKEVLTWARERKALSVTVLP